MYRTTTGAYAMDTHTYTTGVSIAIKYSDFINSIDKFIVKVEGAEGAEGEYDLVKLFSNTFYR